jgi:hypothetical protein
VDPSLHLPDPWLQVSREKLKATQAVQEPDLSAQQPLGDNSEDNSTAVQSPENVAVTEMKSCRKVIKMHLDRMEKAPSTIEEIICEANTWQEVADDNMPLDLTKKNVPWKESVVIKPMVHSMFHQSAIDLTVKKMTPPPQVEKSLTLTGHDGSLDKSQDAVPSNNVNKSPTGTEINHIEGRGKRDNSGVVETADVSSAKKRRTETQEGLTTPSPSFYLHEAHPPQQQVPLRNANQNVSNQQNTASQSYGPGGMITKTFDRLPLVENTAMPYLGVHPHKAYSSPELISSLNQVRRMPNVPHVLDQENLIAQNYLDMVNQHFLAVRTGKGVATGLTRQHSLPSDTMMNAVVHHGSGGQGNNSMKAAQLTPKSSPVSVSSSNGESAARQRHLSGVDVRAQLVEMVQGRSTITSSAASNLCSYAQPSNTESTMRHKSPSYPGQNLTQRPNIHGLGMYQNLNMQLPSPNLQGLRLELNNGRPQYPGLDEQRLTQHRSPMLGLGWNSPSIKSVSGYPPAYPYMYEFRPPFNPNIQPRSNQHLFRSPNMNSPNSQASPNSAGPSRQKSPVVAPEMQSLPTNLTMQGWSHQYMAGMSRQQNPSLIELSSQSRQGTGFAQYACSPQQPRIHISPPTERPRERTLPAITVRHQVVATQNYDLLHQDHPVPHTRGAISTHPTATALPSHPSLSPGSSKFQVSSVISGIFNWLHENQA